MDIGIGLAIGLVVGGLIGFVLLRFFLKSAQSRQLAELNKKVDLEVQEARLSAKRILDDAETQAEKIVGQAESKNERIKQKKIQEAKERFNRLRSQFDSEKAAHKVELKEREMEVKNLENEIAQRREKLEQRAKALDEQVAELEQREAETHTVRENLEKQLKVVARKKEELDAANEKARKAIAAPTHASGARLCAARTGRTTSRFLTH